MCDDVTSIDMNSLTDMAPVTENLLHLDQELSSQNKLASSIVNNYVAQSNEITVGDKLFSEPVVDAFISENPSVLFSLHSETTNIFLRHFSGAATHIIFIMK